MSSCTPKKKSAAVLATSALPAPLAPPRPSHKRKQPLVPQALDAATALEPAPHSSLAASAKPEQAERPQPSGAVGAVTSPSCPPSARAPHAADTATAADSNSRARKRGMAHQAQTTASGSNAEFERENGTGTVEAAGALHCTTTQAQCLPHTSARSSTTSQSQPQPLSPPLACASSAGPASTAPTTPTLQLPFVCVQCPQSFAFHRELARHVANHDYENSKPFPCSGCSSSFSSAQLLTNHHKRCSKHRQSQKSVEAATTAQVPPPGPLIKLEGTFTSVEASDQPIDSVAVPQVHLACYPQAGTALAVEPEPSGCGAGSTSESGCREHLPAQTSSPVQAQDILIEIAPLLPAVSEPSNTRLTQPEVEFSTCPQGPQPTNGAVELMPTSPLEHAPLTDILSRSVVAVDGAPSVPASELHTEEPELSASSEPAQSALPSNRTSVPVAPHSETETDVVIATNALLLVPPSSKENSGEKHVSFQESEPPTPASGNAQSTGTQAAPGVTAKRTGSGTSSRSAQSLAMTSAALAGGPARAHLARAAHFQAFQAESSVPVKQVPTRRPGSLARRPATGSSVTKTTATAAGKTKEALVIAPTWSRVKCSVLFNTSDLDLSAARSQPVALKDIRYTACAFPGCEHIFDSAQLGLLMRHLGVHCIPPWFMCKKCNRTFESVAATQTHELTHSPAAVVLPARASSATQQQHATEPLFQFVATGTSGPQLQDASASAQVPVRSPAGSMPETQAASESLSSVPVPIAEPTVLTQNPANELVSASGNASAELNHQQSDLEPSTTAIGTPRQLPGDNPPSCDLSITLADSQLLVGAAADATRQCAVSGTSEIQAVTTSVSTPTMQPSQPHQSGNQIAPPLTISSGPTPRFSCILSICDSQYGPIFVHPPPTELRDLSTHAASGCKNLDDAEAQAADLQLRVELPQAQQAQAQAAITPIPVSQAVTEPVVTEELPVLVQLHSIHAPLASSQSSSDRTSTDSAPLALAALPQAEAQVASLSVPSSLQPIVGRRPPPIGHSSLPAMVLPVATTHPDPVSENTRSLRTPIKSTSANSPSQACVQVASSAPAASLSHLGPSPTSSGTSVRVVSVPLAVAAAVSNDFSPHTLAYSSQTPAATVTGKSGTSSLPMAQPTVVVQRRPLLVAPVFSKKRALPLPVAVMAKDPRAATGSGTGNSELEVPLAPEIERRSAESTGKPECEIHDEEHAVVASAMPSLSKQLVVKRQPMFAKKSKTGHAPATDMHTGSTMTEPA